jgi:succinoglycan biosynthesis protein ExoV
MKLFYFVSDPPNVGDDLNPWLFDKLLPDLLNNDESELLVGIGTILDSRLPTRKRMNIFGTGVRPPIRVTPDGHWRILALRGPLSADALSVSRSLAVTDPALLAGTYFSYAKPRKIGVPTFVPHVSSAESEVWQQVCHATQIRYLDPRSGVEPFLQGIADASVVLTEAMHGAILADAFRVPWVPVRSQSHKFEGDLVSTFKWKDWCASVNLEYVPLKLPVIWPKKPRTRLETLRQKAKMLLVGVALERVLSDEHFFLSDDSVFRAKCDQLRNIAGDFLRERRN